MNAPKVQEMYVSVDVETAGPIPAEYSLLSLGASVVGDASRHFYAEFQPINRNSVPEAQEVSGFSLETLEQEGEDPSTAFLRFRDWIQEVAPVELHKPVFVGFNAAFDWSFVNWYFHRYTGANPFGFAPLDIKAFYMGLTGCTWAETTSSKLPPRFQPSKQSKAHNALEDAIFQGEIFERMLSGR